MHLPVSTLWDGVVLSLLHCASQWTGLHASKILLSPAPISLQNHWGYTGLLLCPTLQGSGLHICKASTWPTEPIHSLHLETQSPVAQAGLILAMEWRMTLDSWPSCRHLLRITVMSYHTQFTTYQKWNPELHPWWVSILPTKTYPKPLELISLITSWAQKLN